jgi:hypothetical protein
MAFLKESSALPGSFSRARRMPRWQCKRALFGCRVIARRRHRSASPVLPRFANAMASRNNALAEFGVNEVRLNYTRFAFLKNKPVGGLGKIEDFGYIRGDATNPLGVIPTSSKYEGSPSSPWPTREPSSVCPTARLANTTIRIRSRTIFRR